MPSQVTMKRTVLILFALTLVAAIPLAGCGLTHVAGSVLLGGGGLSMVLMVALAFMGAHVTPQATAPATEVAPVAAKVEPVAAVAVAKVEPKAAPTVPPKPAVAVKAEPKSAKLTKSQRRAAAKARAKAAQSTQATPAAPAAQATPAAPAKPKAVVVEAAPEARAPEIEEVAAFFVKAAVKDVEPANDDFAADELAFFAEGENQAMRASDSSPHWHLGQL
jgi:hypothetical protein